MGADITELSEVRRDNIKRLVADSGAKNMKAFCERFDVKYGSMAHIASAKPLRTNIGTRLIQQLADGSGHDIGWFDKDRRKGALDDIPQLGKKEPANGTPVLSTHENTISMRANGFVVENKPLSNHTANQIMKLLLED